MKKHVFFHEKTCYASTLQKTCKTALKLRLWGVAEFRAGFEVQGFRVPRDPLIKEYSLNHMRDPTLF